MTVSTHMAANASFSQFRLPFELTGEAVSILIRDGILDAVSSGASLTSTTEFYREDR